MCNNYRSAYMKFIGEGGLGSSFDVINKKELETVKRHRTKDWRLKQVASKIIDDGKNERAEKSMITSWMSCQKATNPIGIPYGNILTMRRA